MYRSLNSNCHRTKIVDELFYRFPGEKIKQFRGGFQKVAALNETSGFIVSTSTGKELFCFVEDEKSDPNVHPVPILISKQDYQETANSFLKELKAKNITKAILSRVKKYSTDLTPELAFHRLAEEYPEAFVYFFKSKLLGTWIGASPEILCSYEQGIFTTMSLAGTLATASEKSWTQKEREEQAAVTSFILDKLKKHGDQISISDLHEVEAGAVRHLRTNLTCQVHPEKIGELVNELHPTPAVSGLPRDLAMELIKKHEKHNRELYTGFLGLMGHDRSCLYVNLRCAKWIDNNYYLFVGGGLTQASEVEDEWEETENKSQTLLKVLQNI